MKTKLKKNSILFIILIATLFSSCEKELFDEAIRQEKSIIKKIDFKSFKGDIKASQKLERLHEITPNNETNRVEYNSDYDVYYDVDNIILITKENLKYYTIPLIKAENDSLVKNLVLSEKSDGTYKAKISAYKLTEEEIEKIKNGLIVDLNNKGYTKDFIENESRFSEYLSFSQFNQTPCVVSVITDVYCFSGQHEFGDPDCEVSELPPRVIIRYVYGLCDEGGTAGGGGSGNNNNNTTSPSQNDTEGQDDAITTPVIPSLDLSPIRLFVNSLSPDQLNWWNLIATDQEKINIENYVNQNINVDEANEFAKDAIDSFRNGGEVDFIYKIIIDGSLKNNPCLFGVYTQLGKAPTFQNYLQNFDGEFSVANLKLAASSALPSNRNAETSPPSNYLITITFNVNNLNRPSLSIARTFIHEMIHAEIFRKLLSCANLPNLNFSNYTSSEWTNFIVGLKDNYPGLYDYYLRYFFNVPAGQVVSDEQHQLMAQHYRTIIVNTLKQFDNTKPESLYQALAWEGLQNTVAWNLLSPSEKASINTIISNFNSSNSNCQ